MLKQIQKILNENTFVDMEILQGIQLDDDLTELGLDSINVVYVIGDLEECFDIVFSPDDLLLNNFSTYNKIITLISNYISLKE